MGKKEDHSKDWEFDWEWVQPHVEKFIVSDMIRKARLETCKGCDKLNKINICKVCGCFAPLKILLVHEECPIGKWGPLE